MPRVRVPGELAPIDGQNPILVARNHDEQQQLRATRFNNNDVQPQITPAMGPIVHEQPCITINSTHKQILLLMYNNGQR